MSALSAGSSLTAAEARQHDEEYGRICGVWRDVLPYFDQQCERCLAAGVCDHRFETDEDERGVFEQCGECGATR